MFVRRDCTIPPFNPRSFLLTILWHLNLTSTSSEHQSERHKRSGSAVFQPKIALAYNGVIGYNKNTGWGQPQSMPVRATGCQGRETGILGRFSVSLFFVLLLFRSADTAPSRSHERNGSVNRQSTNGRCSIASASDATSENKK